LEPTDRAAAALLAADDADDGFGDWAPEIA
jgi:hypothetical protein